MTECKVDGCEKPTVARGLCNRHYRRWRAHGDPLGGGERYATPEEAFEARTEPLLWSGCVVWTGATNSKGYGQLAAYGRMVYAHRFAWEQINGPIPAGMVIDHICHVRSCVNVQHLRIATPTQNQQNRSGACSNRAHALPRGVTRRRKGYEAQVQVGGTRHYLGIFPTVDAAAEAAETARRIHCGEFAGGA